MKSTLLMSLIAAAMVFSVGNLSAAEADETTEKASPIPSGGAAGSGQASGLSNAEYGYLAFHLGMMGLVIALSDSDGPAGTTGTTGTVGN